MSEEQNKLELEGQAPAPENNKEESPLEGFLCCWAQALIAAVATVVLLFTFGVRMIGVSGPSMQEIGRAHV